MRCAGIRQRLRSTRPVRHNLTVAVPSGNLATSGSGTAYDLLELVGVRIVIVEKLVLTRRQSHQLLERIGHALQTIGQLGPLPSPLGRR